MADIHTPKKYLLKAVISLRNDGSKVFIGKSFKKIADKLNQSAARLVEGSGSLTSFNSIVDRRDVMTADITEASPSISQTKQTNTKTIAWFISPPRSGGGHQNMFRFIEHLDGNGYNNNIYLYTTNDRMSTAEAEENVSKYANLSRTKFRYFDRSKPLLECDAVFATGWETAYPVLNAKTTAKKYYFVQDFEPMFYPVGTEYILAENTYKFGFKGITAGGWLSRKLSDEYGMECVSYKFGAEKGLYSLTNSGKRKEVFFYARPVTERRAFDLGIMTLEIFHKLHPDYVINLAGWDISDYRIDFPYVNHKTMPLNQLAKLYNDCSAALVLSLTNMSLMPLELLACGTIPVVNDGPNNRLVSDNEYIEYAEPTPMSLAHRMSNVVTDKDQVAKSEAAARSVADSDWEAAKKIFITTIEKDLYA